MYLSTLQRMRLDFFRMVEMSVLKSQVVAAKESLRRESWIFSWAKAEKVGSLVALNLLLRK